MIKSALNIKVDFNIFKLFGFSILIWLSAEKIIFKLFFRKSHIKAIFSATSRVSNLFQAK